MQTTTAPLQVGELEYLRQLRITWAILGSLTTLGVWTVVLIFGYGNPLVMALSTVVPVSGFLISFFNIRQIVQDGRGNEKICRTGRVTKRRKEVSDSSKKSEKDTFTYYIELDGEQDLKVPEYQYHLALEGAEVTLETLPRSKKVLRLVVQDLPETPSATPQPVAFAETEVTDNSREIRMLSEDDKAAIRAQKKVAIFSVVLKRGLGGLVLAGLLWLVLSVFFFNTEGDDGQLFFLLFGLITLLAIFLPVVLLIQGLRNQPRLLQKDLKQGEKILEIWQLQRTEKGKMNPNTTHQTHLLGRRGLVFLHFEPGNHCLRVGEKYLAQSSRGQLWEVSYLPHSRQVLALQPKPA